MGTLFEKEKPLVKKTAEDMEKYLAQRYSHPYEWVFMTQVRNSTGSASRIADAMAFNMYQSTGYEILGFEIKVSRSDWLHELKDMSKSNEIMEYCDKWFLVVPDANIVKEGELPKNWGLLVLKDDKLVVKVRAIPTKKTTIPDYFFASLLRRYKEETNRIASTYIPKEQIKPELEKARKLGYEDAVGYQGKRIEQDLERLRTNVIAFEQASGVQIQEWRGAEYNKSLGMYVKFALSLGEGALKRHITEMELLANKLNKAAVELKKIEDQLKQETHGTT